jgi:hypothetical protein
MISSFSAAVGSNSSTHLNLDAGEMVGPGALTFLLTVGMRLARGGWVTVSLPSWAVATSDEANPMKTASMNRPIGFVYIILGIVFAPTEQVL